MTVEQINAMPAINGLLNTAEANNAGVKDFSAWLGQQVSSANHQILDADVKLRQLALGESTNLHQVMMSLENAKLSFSLVVQVQNKLMQAYQDVMRMQV